ncbi:unnamed protein product [Anisakis simplex]|uniref:SAM-dependent MTase TRM10-type domain-containing protein n=1 Tax=Anisakis simplex TaxID=6269 RepID=A0A0M3K7Q2_ANISI|nr:unnamed protein product [Anisakis simplex]
MANISALEYFRAVEGRRLHRKVERKRRRSRKAVANMELFKLDSELTLIIDLGYTNAMNNKELCKLVRQMGRVWGLQKRYVGLITILLSPCEKFIGESRRVLTGFDSFKWTIMYKNIEQCSNKRLIYLSPDASLAPLESLSSNEAYVIGGLVDETGRGSLSKDRAGLLNSVSCESTIYSPKE